MAPPVLTHSRLAWITTTWSLGMKPYTSRSAKLFKSEPTKPPWGNQFRISSLYTLFVVVPLQIFAVKEQKGLGKQSYAFTTVDSRRERGLFISWILSANVDMKKKSSYRWKIIPHLETKMSSFILFQGLKHGGCLFLPYIWNLNEILLSTFSHWKVALLGARRWNYVLAEGAYLYCEMLAKSMGFLVYSGKVWQCVVDELRRTWREVVEISLYWLNRNAIFMGATLGDEMPVV